MSTTIKITKTHAFIWQDLIDFEHSVLKNSGVTSYVIEMGSTDFGKLKIIYENGHADVWLFLGIRGLISNSDTVLGKHVFRDGDNEYIVKVEEE